MSYEYSNYFVHNHHIYQIRPLVTQPTYIIIITVYIRHIVHLYVYYYTIYL